jgi:hypothetical protein
VLFSSSMVLKVADFGLAVNLREERAVTRVGESPTIRHTSYAESELCRVLYVHAQITYKAWHAFCALPCRHQNVWLQRC